MSEMRLFSNKYIVENVNNKIPNTNSKVICLM